MSVLIGKCVAAAKKNVVRLTVPKLKFDDFLNKHFRESDSVMAYDDLNVCKDGDWVLVRKVEDKISEIDYKVDKVVYQAGNIIDPITGKKTLEYENVDSVKRLSKVVGK